VAAALGIDSTLVSRYASGMRCPAPARALELAELLDRDVAELFPSLFSCHDTAEARPHTLAAAVDRSPD
jgi:transcriptional regulator with XRE-family HTH domain